MICYRDMTFCGFYKDCKLSRRCSRALTKKVLTQATRFGLPVCQFKDKPNCWEAKNEQEGVD